MKLDFRVNGRLSQDCVLRLNRIAHDIRDPFTKLIETISRDQAASLDWWVALSLRDPFASPLFLYCCYLGLLKELVEAGIPVEEVVVNSPAMRQIASRYLEEARVEAVVRYQRSLSERLKRVVRPFVYALYVPCRYLRQKYWAWATRENARPLPTNPITLIDTFIVFSFSEEKEHYYPGLLEQLTEDEQAAVYFLPTVIKLDKPGELFSELRRSNKNFLLKEDFLRWSDYLFAWSHPFRFLPLPRKVFDFLGFHLFPLIDEEAKSWKGYENAFLALLNFRFALRLQRSSIEVRLLVDWFEDQTIDKGLVAGFKRFYPDTTIVGYQGFIPPSLYLSQHLTELERQSGLLPHQLAVVGSGLQSNAKRYCDALDVPVGPAFRFRWLWEERKLQPDPQRFTILVSLSMMPKERRELLHSVERGLRGVPLDSVQVWVKPHPNTKREEVEKGFGKVWPSLFKFVDGAFRDVVERSNLLISNTSSACVETLARGIPVIVSGSQTGLTYNPIPDGIPKKIWKLCYTTEEMTRAIRFFMEEQQSHTDEFTALGIQICRDYFAPVTRESVLRFLQLDNGDHFEAA